MQASNFSFSLYRLDIVDEFTLFPSKSTPPIRGDKHLISVIKNSTNPKFDKQKGTQKATYQWSVREFTDYGTLNNRGNFVSVVLARSVLEQEGQVVTTKNIVIGISARSKQWKKSLTSIMLDSASSLNLTSSIHFEEIPEKHEILKLFFSFERLTRLKVHLRLPNPELSRYTKNLFKDLQESEIRDYVQDMKNPSGISKRKEARPHASAALAQAGYKMVTYFLKAIRMVSTELLNLQKMLQKGKLMF